ncbi:MAG: helix-turn-helix transcriptional regulator [Clostridia bacterium]|nr:helix-turn-helix transcriptional regulator [Clostridia bacterium]
MYFQLNLQTLPTMGFAHHFYAENYRQFYGIADGSFELVYVWSGDMRISLENETIDVPQGSLFLLFRELPLRFETVDNTPHSHTSIQLRCEFLLSRFKVEIEGPEGSAGLLLPMVFRPCEDAKRIGRKMSDIVAKLQQSRAENEQCCVAAALGILAELDDSCRKGLSAIVPSERLLANNVSRWIEGHLRDDTSLERVAAVVGRSPNYVNAVFKRVNGVPVRQYVNHRKAVLMAELMAYKNVDFRTACENVGIADAAYGYRLFKKQLGTTPRQYVCSVYAQDERE